MGGIDLASHYYELFKNRRQDVRKVLEIGIGHEGCMGSGYRTGASLFMWEEFFPNADIYALDNMTEILINQGRIHSRWCDQGSEESLKQVMPFLGRDFDLIVDDGSHIPEHQALTVRVFAPLLSSRGIYVVEDVWLAHRATVSYDLAYKFEWKEFCVNGVVGDLCLVIKAEEQ